MKKEREEIGEEGYREEDSRTMLTSKRGRVSIVLHSTCRRFSPLLRRAVETVPLST